jgi:single-strand DNA-binding protein
MASSLNKVILIGNVGKDPEIRSTNEGKEIATLSLATSEVWRDRVTGEKKERTEWHRVVVFNEGLAGVVKNYVKKGSKIYIEGALQTRKWVDNAGVEKYTTEVVLQNFSSSLIMLDNKNSSGSEGAQMSDSGGGTSRSGGGGTTFDHSELDDNIPF